MDSGAKQVIPAGQHVTRGDDADYSYRFQTDCSAVFMFCVFGLTVPYFIAARGIRL
jgi:hypothetical protein